MQEPVAKPVAKRPASGRGRPKDPLLESKVYEAAIKLYSDVGWSGFNFEQISKLAGVGKAALYSRWPTREELLVATFETRWSALSAIDTGSLKGDILAVAEFAMWRYTTSNIVLHMQVDGRRDEEFRKMATPFASRTTQAIRSILERWVDRGGLSPDENVDLLVNMLMGTITSRVARIEMQPMNHDQPEARQFIEDLVEFMMRALTAPRGDSSPQTKVG